MEIDDITCSPSLGKEVIKTFLEKIVDQAKNFKIKLGFIYKDNFEPRFNAGILTPEQEAENDAMRDLYQQKRIYLRDLAVIDANLPKELNDNPIIINIEMRLKKDQVLLFLENRNFNFSELSFNFRDHHYILTLFGCKTSIEGALIMNGIAPIKFI